MSSTYVTFTPGDWFWSVGGDTTKVWSSALSNYVSEWSADRLTMIANEVEIYDVLSKAGLASRAPSRSFTVSEVRDALLRIDAELTGNANTAEDLKAVAGEMGFILPPIA